eukprot:6022187-Prymnesium_polylepis.1
MTCNALEGESKVLHVCGIIRCAAHTLWAGLALGLPFLVLMRSRRATRARSTACIRSIEANGAGLRRGASRETTRPPRTRLALVCTGEIVPCPHSALRTVERCWASQWTVFPEVAHVRNAGGNGAEEAFGTDTGALWA